jgi:hypothetical protein
VGATGRPPKRDFVRKVARKCWAGREMVKTLVSRTSGLPQAKLPTNNDAQWIDCGQCEVAGVIPQDLALGFQKGSSVPSLLL